LEQGAVTQSNGTDIGAVYNLLVHMSGRLDTVSERLDSNERKLGDLMVGLADLRTTVTNYHSTVLGHGILISELDERVRRIEPHLKLEPAGK
jgi:hypothetical protein